MDLGIEEIQSVEYNYKEFLFMLIRIQHGYIIYITGNMLHIGRGKTIYEIL